MPIMLCHLVSILAIVIATLSSVECNSGPTFNIDPSLIVSESTPVGTILVTLTATDSDGPQPLFFSIPSGHPSAQLVELRNQRGESTTGRMVDVVLKSQLDRDFTEDRSPHLRFAVEDNHGGTGNYIIQETTMYITDVNDVAPAFTQSRYEHIVLENAAKGFVVTKVTATDPDTGRGGQVKYSMTAVGQAVSADYTQAFLIDADTGDVKVNTTLDANKYNYYEYTLYARDADNLEGTSVLLLKIQDVQDKPPYFTNLPYSQNILENATLNTPVLQVTAQDGDKGVPNEVRYSFHSGDYQSFAINETTGWITVKTSLDRDTADVTQKGGVYAIYVKAREVDSNSQPESLITATTLVTIKVEDVNDNAPQFNSPTYTASILENMQEGVPITFTGPGNIAYMNVSDIDQGVNSNFELYLMKDGEPYTDFSPLPNQVFVESSVLIRVQNSSALDYELAPSLTFQIVAREINTLERRSSVATVTVNITDMNDNAPVFVPATLPPIKVLENTTTGTLIATLNATDKDRGLNGQIAFNIRGADALLKINATTGALTLFRKLDREEVDVYFVTAEARDGGGLTTFTNLEIQVGDVNDNAPMFRREEYYVTVREDSLRFLRGDLLVEATDADEPNTDNSRVRYQILSASSGLKNKFAIDTVTGNLTLVSHIDYESLPAVLNGRVLVEVEAYDLGEPRMARTINITVEIEDVNDNTPQFNQTLYTARVEESAAAGTSVVQVFALDGDSTPPSNKVLYRIDSGASDKFRIDFTTGEVSVEVGAQLDRERQDTYTLNVSATDRGAVPLTGSCQLVITILDVNDEPPMFTPETTVTSVNEIASPGSNVTCLEATDPDMTSELNFDLLPDSMLGFDEVGRSVNVSAADLKGYFMMERTTGCIKVAGQLDRETVELIIIKAIVWDTKADSAFPGQTATGTVSITLLDSNDNPPEFQPNSSYSLRVSEGLEVDANIMRFETRDRDKGQSVTYAISLDPHGNFNIDSGSGQLTLKSRLDRETVNEFVMKVTAVDSGQPNRLTSTATVSVTVQDINDNAPTFKPHQVEYTIPENAAVETPIGLIQADDSDHGEFGRVVYSLDVNDNDDKLTINSTTGLISVGKSLDRETRPSYTVFVRAIDNPSDPENQRTNQTRVVINVGDVNDNDPVFTNIDSSAWPTVLENENPPKLIFTVTAEDADTGVNAELDYTLKGDAETLALFSITTTQRHYGEIKVASSLFGKTGEHHFNISVTDRGSPARSASTPFVIDVQDVNNFAPKFVKPAGTNATINFLETNLLNEVVFQVEASDADSGRNAKITFSLVQEGDWEKFQIHPDTGVLTNTAELDREMHEKYLIKIKAEDNGVPTPLSTVLTLTIVILDTNDNPPEFVDDRSGPYILHVQEERVAAESAAQLNIAVDKDAGNNSIICYYIIGGDPLVSSHFSLAQDGILTMTQALDRETLKESSVNMIIMATPRCFENIPMDTRPAFYPPTNYNNNRTLLWVKVIIDDINDNPPQFKQSVLTLGVTRDTGFGTSITNLQDLVTDADETMKVEFSALSTEQHLQQSISVAHPFLVFKNGTVATNMYFKPNMYGYFLIHIQAKENVTGGLPFIANATLRISLINDDQRLKVVFRNSPDVVRGFQVIFTQRLSNTTGYRIVVDKIQTHESGGTQINQNMTDMFIHGEDMKTNETISAAELLRVIDSFAVALLGLRYDYKVIEIVPTVSQKEEQSLENVYKMALILVSCILALLCVAIIIVFYISRQQYKRKLKAATALAYVPRGLVPRLGSKSVSLEPVQGKIWRQLCPPVPRGSSSDLHKLEMPGTNVHAYENANPIYLEKVLLEEAGEQDDDDSLDNNAVEHSSPSRYDEQHMSMNFHTEDNNVNKVPQSKLGNGDAILSAALLQHDTARVNGTASTSKPSDSMVPNTGNGHIEHKQDNFAGLPTTEI